MPLPISGIDRKVIIATHSHTRRSGLLLTISMKQGDSEWDGQSIARSYTNAY